MQREKEENNKKKIQKHDSSSELEENPKIKKNSNIKKKK